MTATITHLFCGAGGSSLGAEAAGNAVTPPVMAFIVRRIIEAMETR